MQRNNCLLKRRSQAHHGRCQEPSRWVTGYKKLGEQFSASTPDRNSTVSSTMSAEGSPTWSEPPWSGWIETTGDALLILEAARRGLIPRVTRRLVDSERKMITSGSVFVFDEDESGIKRWTDGYFWSPSRILGNFLLYRETDKRGAGHHRGTKFEPSVPEEQNEQVKVEGQALSRPKTEQVGVDKQRERTLLGSLTKAEKFKSDGLMKKTFSLSIGGVAQHLISYYKVEDVEKGRLRSPSSLPELASLDISPEYLDKTHFRNPPKVEIGPDGVPRYRGEADDIDNSPTLASTAPLSTNLPLLSEPRVAEPTKRPQRFDPYTNQTKRRKSKPVPSDPAPAPAPSTEPHEPNNIPVAAPPHYPAYYATSYPTQHPHMYPVTPGYPGHHQVHQNNSTATAVPQYPYPTYPSAPASAEHPQPYYQYYPYANAPWTQPYIYQPVQQANQSTASASDNSEEQRNEAG
ncbi:Gti1/Pac2 family-domain-containing protein [Mycena floridula]|nr:Gti1/Pac2 family-domain-containing protein [Mycena floridula]